ncbi:NAD-dependent succinate-semialdehyde dehydrogenase [Shewanella gelidii]|uniref:NAD-dependent succinate-semialdehyde dehydrogenase n=1 Tax=Shewanella gelidii TaxID=1642821 RepID=A0A917JKT1_9GAMM|nr:NAD-dependent succinate-semialdehyde dehydrogenase [Shewanella gelidii]MCL1096731.1 NAD-dependent succinate-semialdehyde dehydrogenase [Shewanella gelidii]GGI69803.1 NAD-dependent succinate-semialdehyde dehydrogenase [Shewanella gelidii]
MQLADPQLLRDKAYINGQWCLADSGDTTAIYNPADASFIGEVPQMGAKETHHAILVAQQAQTSWAKQTAKFRSEIMLKWYALVIQHQNDLAHIITLEQGKPLAESLAEILYAASFIQWFAEEAKRVYGDTIPAPQTDVRIQVLKQPVGVTAAITPWNFPAAMVTRKLAPALAAGCSMVLKPAPQTPFTALALAELAHRAGVPPGLLNVVTGDAEAIGRTLCDSPIVKKLSFTGSTAVGIHLMQQCAPTLKKLSLELGGNAPLIVFADANVEEAVAGAMLAKFRNAGQTCICANRIYVHEKVYQQFITQFAQAMAELKVGSGFDLSTNIGPLINSAAKAKMKEHLDDAKAKGAQIIQGGRDHTLGGNYFEPTLLIDATADMLIAQEETFAPLAPIFKFHHEDEVIAAANATEFGLAAYLYTQNISLMTRVTEALEYGMVGVNTGAISNEVAPFGGVKSSGLGREGSKYGMEEYLELKYLCIKV